MGAPVVVTWISPSDNDGALRYLSHSTHDHLSLSIYRNVVSSTAFFQLRASVAFKTRRDRTNILMSIPPENIQALALIDDGKGIEVATSCLATTTRCLRFHLRAPPSVIVPKGDITPKQKGSRIVLDSLRALASETAFSLHIPSLTISNTQLVALCTAVTSGTLRSTDRFLDIASLYGGKGGRVLEGEEALGQRVSGPPSTIGPSSMPGGQLEARESPPSYDESNVQPNTSRLSRNKRRRASSGSDTGASSSRPRQCLDSKTVSMEDVCQKMIARIDQGFNQIGSRLDRMEKRLSDLECCVGRHTETLGTSIKQVQTRSSEQVEDLRDQLDAGLYDIRKETQDIIVTQVEDEMYVAREHLEDFVKDEMVAVEERLEQKLEHDLTGANVSLEFSWNR